MMAPQAAVERAMDRLLALEGASPLRRRLRCRDVDIHVLEQGSGPALLLLHGGGGGAANWYRLVAPLARDHRVIAPDLPGFGLSDDLPPRIQLGLQAAELLGDLLDQLAIVRVSVLGTSFGGLAALRLAQHFPNRIRRLLLLDSAGLGESVPRLVRLGLLPLLGELALAPSRAGTRLLLRRLLTSTRLDPVHERALVDYLHASAVAHRRMLLPALRAFVAGSGQRERCTPGELSAVRAPTLLLWGARDRFFPLAHARASAPCFARAELSVLEGVGHSPNWEAPLELLVRLRRFLDTENEAADNE